jgi:hypothetical protein
MAFHLTHCVALVPHTASLLSHQRKHRNWITPASRFSYFLHSHPVVLFVVFQPQYSPTSVRLNSSLEVSSVCVCPQFLSHFRHIFSDPKLFLQPAYSPTSVSHLLCEMGFFLISRNGFQHKICTPMLETPTLLSVQPQYSPTSVSKTFSQGRASIRHFHFPLTLQVFCSPSIHSPHTPLPVHNIVQRA